MMDDEDFDWQEEGAQRAPFPYNNPDTDEDPKRPAAVLWVPDPEQKSGWREFYVQRVVKPGHPKSFGYAGMKKKR